MANPNWMEDPAVRELSDTVRAKLHTTILRRGHLDHATLQTKRLQREYDRAVHETMAAGMSRNALAKALGISPQAVAEAQKRGKKIIDPSIEDD